MARLAGVAVGTVSNVLHHPELVRPQTRARVEAAMEQLGFIPNASARQLRAGRGRCLGLVVALAIKGIRDRFTPDLITRASSQSGPARPAPGS